MMASELAGRLRRAGFTVLEVDEWRQESDAGVTLSNGISVQIARNVLHVSEWVDEDTVLYHTENGFRDVPALVDYLTLLVTVRQHNLTLPQLRCDVRPGEHVLALVDRLGCDRYDSTVERYSNVVGR